MKLSGKLILFFSFLIFSNTVFADEGMWLPQLLEKLNEKKMRQLGMKLTAKDIYDINKGSLKDAIVSFGGFCTGEVISEKGLLLTNYHCGFDEIQNHSSLENNLIKNGFWAKKTGDELPNPGLFVTFIVRIDEVTSQVLNGVSPTMSEKERQSIIDKNIADIRKNRKKEPYQDIIIRPFFEGNEYYLFVTETYRDIRLVGAPPSSIGNFGKDTDNWMWPRHTGDFALFRIYAGKDNKPADYSPENVPFTPRRFLSVSTAGVREGDFTMVFGFPGRTMQYLHSSAVEQIMKINNPVKIAIREKALKVIDEFMRRDEKIKIQYASKYAGIQNAYKKWQGELMGLTQTRAVERKKSYEAEFLKRVNANPQWKEKYGTLIDELTKSYREFESFGKNRDIFNETLSRIEAFSMAAQVNRLLNALQNNGEKGLMAALPEAENRLEELYAEYNKEVDRNLFSVLMQHYLEVSEREFLSPEFLSRVEKAGSVAALAENIYSESKLVQGQLLDDIQKNPVQSLPVYEKDPVIQLYQQLTGYYNEKVSRRLSEMQSNINRLQRLYMEAQREVFKEKVFYPDANGTLRITYGQVKRYNPRDAVMYEHITYLDGVMEKYKPGDYEFDVPEKLIMLYKNKDYGPYGEGGKMPVCFIAGNHTSGGNSGSPALDAYGNLIGLNFDRVWEGTMSDIYYNPEICRNIMVDVRYILFIIDKFAGAGHLIKEMKLVRPKK
ncbi:MAG: S46 family peptidase [Chitinophagaceae bacterium]|nr:S46 family peptidase [Chitinophagaceae bacterium]